MTAINRYFTGKHLVFVLVFVGIYSLVTPSMLRTQCAWAQFEPGNAERDYSEAYKLFSDQIFREAIQAFSNFRETYPDHLNAADALYFQAEAALSLGLEDEAVHLFRLFERDYPVHPLSSHARLALGKYFYDNGDYTRAGDTFADILDDNPPDVLAAKTLYWMGESALRQQRYTQAIQHFQRAADTYRNTATAPVALYAIGVTKVQQGQYNEAAEAFEVLAARYPESAYARNIGLALAEVYYELSDYQRTITEIQRRRQSLGPEAFERATFLLAESYNQLRDSENAIVYYRRFTENNPDSPYYRRALYGLAWNYYFEGVYQWAVDHFTRVREGFSDELAEKATYYEAINQKLAERPLQAIDAFNEYLSRWPNGILADHAQMELGITYYQQRMWRDADQAFARVIDYSDDPELEGQALYLRGNTSVALGDFDRAFSHFDEAVSLDAAPTSLKEQVVFQRAWLLYRNDNFSDAAPAFMQLYERAPRSDQGGEALFWAAECYYQLNNQERATRIFQQYLREFPGGRQVDAAYYALGWTFFRQRRYNDAITQFQHFLDEYRVPNDYVPYRTDALLRTADSYYAMKRYPEAIRIYSRVADEGGDYALYQIGQAFYNAGDSFEAIAAFRRLIEEHRISDWSEEAQYTIGYIYFQNQDFDRAIEEYRKIVVQQPNDPLAAKALYGIGDAFYNAGDHESAVRSYSQLLESYPNSPYVSDAAAGIQYALTALGEEERAAEVIDSFAEQHPGSPVVDELRFRQAEVKYQSGRTDEAMTEFLRYIRTSRNDRLLPEAYFYLGVIYADLRMAQEAVSYLRQIVDSYEQSDRFPEAARRLGQLYLEDGRNNEAIAVFRKLESTRRSDGRIVAEARYGQGVALINMGRNREAERLLQEAIDAAPDAPETMPAILGLARVHEESGRSGEAMRLYQHVIDKSSDEVGAEALYRYGNLLIERGNARQGIEELSRLPVLFIGYSDWVAEGYLLQARTFARIGQTGEAARVYDQILMEFSGTSYAQTAQQEKDEL